MFSMIRLIILDWNGTAIDDAEIVYGSVVEIFKAFGVKAPSKETYLREVKTDFLSFYKSHGLPENTTAEELGVIRERYLRERFHMTRLRPGVTDLLKHCKTNGIHVAIVSGEIDSILRHNCQRLGLLPLLDHIEGDARDKEKKLRMTLEFLKVNPSETIYIDDTRDGLEAGKKIGLTTVGFLYGYSSVEEIIEAQPDYCARFFHEITKGLERNKWSLEARE